MTKILTISSSSSHHQNCNPCISSSSIPFPTEDNLEYNDQVSCICGTTFSYSHLMRNHCFLRIFQSDHVLRTSGISSRAVLAPGSILQDHQGYYQNLHIQIQTQPWPSGHVVCHSLNHRDLSFQQARTREYLAFRGYRQDQETCSQPVLVSSDPEYQMRNQAISTVSSPPHGQ